MPTTRQSAVMSPSSQPLVVVLMGPTASGKTALAIEIAKALDLAVLSVDSRQLYKDMSIGTAKPTAEQRAAVRHELLDLRPPDQPINLQEFRQEADQAIAAEHRRRGVAFLVGGSGLYIKAITQGMTPPAVPPQPRLRADLEALGQGQCYALLRQADPSAAERIMANDAVRTQRALEVLYATGRPLSQQQGSNPPPWRVLELGLNPSNLKQRIAQRSQTLYSDGLVAETQGLQQRYGVDCPLLDTIGYAEAAALLRGELNEQQAIEQTTKRTQQFAKRQRTWFRRQHQPLWLDAPGQEGNPLERALSAIEHVLG
ncbi:tRNA (adenosine(37)-N6)-dimethylallyltransferase MiaA [Synechococcus sp. A10-1-5-1]|uniref:tRNA (adenosine(37)-N6)-dimethylallyltransferase MiaA n=1 Tax=Synechococcus sp. A10-1-5-1 TaxID=2936507 RepID=UPI0035300A4B